jgi:hypothetical protein
MIRKILKGKVGEYFSEFPALSDQTDWTHMPLEIIELPPQRRTIRWVDIHKKKYTSNLPLPYMQFIFSRRADCPEGGRIAVAFSAKPHQLGQQFYHTAFPNTEFSGMVCQDSAATVEEAVAVFFGSYFENISLFAHCRKFSQLAGFPPFYGNGEDEWYYLCWEELDEELMCAVDWDGMGNLAGYQSDSQMAGFEKGGQIGEITPFLSQVWHGDY